MKVDVSGIIGNEGALLEIVLEGQPVDRKPVDGYVLDEKIFFRGTVTNNNSLLLLNGNLKANYKSECYRCLKPVRGTLNIVINEEFISDNDTEQTDMYPYEGKIVDISKALNDNIILNLPLKQLCTKDCKGLCSRCGADLNDEKCNCVSTQVDPRMEGLKKYFDNL